MVSRRKRNRAGRPSLGARARTKPVIVKLSEREHAAIVEAVARENAEIEADTSASADDRKPATVSSWIRDHALSRSGWPTTGATRDRGRDGEGMGSRRGSRSQGERAPRR